MAERLTEQQRQAVENRGGRLLVSAAAGSGKTKVLVDRLMGYLTDPVDPANLDDFLIITYTKAAAAELRGKIGAKLSERIAREPGNRHLQRQMQRLYLAKISTVHAFCADVLRDYAYCLDLPADFRVGDENECRELRQNAMEQVLEQAYSHAGESPAFCAFVDSQGLGRDDRLVPEILLKVYDSARCHMDPEAWLESCREQTAGSRWEDAAQTPWGAYLMQWLFSYLDLQIQAMEHCGERLAETAGLEKAAALVKENVQMLRRLRACDSWQALCGFGPLKFGTLRLPVKNNPDPQLTDVVKQVRNGCKEGLEKRMRPIYDSNEEIHRDMEQTAAAVEGMLELVRAFDRVYSGAKRSRRILDFSDLEHRMLDLLLGRARSGPTQAASEIGARFREVLVDEYQDSNAVQDAIFTALTRQRGNCFMVGDVKQSIYQFRLADPSIFLEKYRSFVPAEEALPGQGRKVLLSRNFRSGKAVLEAVNDVFRLCMSPQVGGLDYTDAEALRVGEGLPWPELGEPEVELHVIDARHDSRQEEAAFVAERICRLLDGTHMVRQGESLRPIVPEDIAVLVRSAKTSAPALQRALSARGIRVASGGGVNLLETQEVGTARAFLQTIANPRQDIPLLAVLASPLFGFTADELASLRCGGKNRCVYQSVLEAEGEKWRKFRDVLAALRREARSKRLPELLESALRLTRMEGVYGAMEGGAERVENLRAFYQTAADFDASGGRDLNQFLDYLTGMEEKGLNTAEGNGAAGCVRIVTIHKSKGLEFPVVVLCGLAREFNQESQRAQVLCDRELGLGLCAVDETARTRYPTLPKRAIAAKMGTEGLSEELRVLYVAMTRAKDRLIMTFSRENMAQRLAALAGRMALGGERLLAQEALCPGDWILMAAMRRTEAGELFAVSGHPHESRVSEIPWLIRLHEGGEVPSGAPAQTPNPAEGEQPSLSPETEARLRRMLAFRYGHLPATRTPSKQTATQRKGREKDREAAEYAPAPRESRQDWRTPGLRQGASGKEFGIAMHGAMQMLRFDACGDLQGIEQELMRLAEKRLLTREQCALVDRQMLADFFASEMGLRLRKGGNVLREFKFSLLDDAGAYGPGLEGEQVLLQGVVDCALVEADGITVLDFKTDRVTEATLEERAKQYAPQVGVYAQALERIFRLPVKRRCLYFFRMNRLVEL